MANQAGFICSVLTPEEQSPDRVLDELRPLLDELYIGLEDASARTDDWFTSGGHEVDPYFRAMMIRYHVREHLQRWQAALQMSDVEDDLDVRLPSNVGLHIGWRDRYLVRVRMGDDQAIPVPTTGAAVDFFNQPLFGLDLPILRLFVLWTIARGGVVLHVACPVSATQGRKDSLQLAWLRAAAHPLELAAAAVREDTPAAAEDEVPWEVAETPDERAGRELPR
jgi:hypothetical protein